MWNKKNGEYSISQRFIPSTHLSITIKKTQGGMGFLHPPR